MQHETQRSSAKPADPTRRPFQAMSALQVLQATRKKISLPGNWCKGTWARNALGNPVDKFSSSAVAWDLMGALLIVSAAPGVMKALSLLRTANGDRPLGPFNDRSTHEEVLALLDSAIDLAERRQGSAK